MMLSLLSPLPPVQNSYRCTKLHQITPDCTRLQYYLRKDPMNDPQSTTPDSQVSRTGDSPNRPPDASPQCLSMGGMPTLRFAIDGDENDLSHRDKDKKSEHCMAGPHEFWE